MENYLLASSAVYGQILFIKILGVCFFFAFLSLSQQVLGLYGSRGILPVGDLLDRIQQRITEHRYLYFPTIFWYSASDKMLVFAARLGTALSLLVILGFAPALLLLALTILYLSFTTIGSEFLSFQWDALLIEVGFLGFLYAIQSPPPAMVVVLAWFLLFRFLFSSGAVKLLSRCPEWKSMNAMKMHFETQPLPNRGGYFANFLLKNFTRAATISVFFFELVVPFLIFGGTLARLWAFILSVFFQCFIIATGNYAFFNLLTIGLCFTLLDDRYLSSFHFLSISALAPNLVLTVILNIAAAIMLLPNVLILLRLFIRIKGSDSILRWFSHFQIVNSYGLFAVMTTERNEIILEGSNDGIEWKEYQFKWKPGRLEEPPKQIAPFQPRLDWQMWFASLGSYRQNPWFYQLLARMLQGSPDVLALFKNNPFPNAPPKIIRAEFYEYHFNDPQDKKLTGRWWKKRYLGHYAPPFSLTIDE